MYKRKAVSSGTREQLSNPCAPTTDANFLMRSVFIAVLLIPFESINRNNPVSDVPALFFSVAIPHHNGGSD
jgi:hypothetical protein